MVERDMLSWEVICRKIDGNLSEEEEKELQCWLQEDTQRRKFLASVEKYYASEELPILGERRIDVAWERFRMVCPVRRRTRYDQLFRWSVAACIILFVGLSAWFAYREVQPAVLPSEMAEVIMPGSHKACLILSDGKIVDLQGKLELTDREVNIRLDSFGITYGQVDQRDSMAYNTLRIPQGGEYCLSMSDGTRVWLNSNTDLVYPLAFAGNERRVRLCGEAYFEVAHNPAKPFIVETDRQEVKVLGTSFNINSYRDDPEMVTTLVTGRVQIQSPGQAVRVLKPSEQSLLNRETGQLLIRRVNTSDFTKWREGMFVFRDADLETVMRILSRWYDMQYEFTLPELKTERFYGWLNRYSDVSQLLEQFEKTGKVHFNFIGKKVIITK